MADRERLWYPIEQAFYAIEQLCMRARATELLAHKRDNEPNWLEVPEAREPDVYAEAERDERFPEAADLAADPAFQEKVQGWTDLVALRAEVRKRLVWLKGRLSEALTEREVYYCLFPLVVYADELVYAAVDKRAATYHPLQTELYEIDNGGEMFYTLIEDLLRKDETLPIIFEVFYFCLNDGFLGMHEQDSGKRDEYKNRLAFRIPVTEVEPSGLQDGGEHAVRLVPFPKWYYIGAAVCVAGAFVLFKAVAYFEIVGALRTLP